MPKDPGVYQFLDTNGNVLYVGKAKNLKNRVSSYFANRSSLEPKTAALVSQVEKISVIPVESEIEALLLEANLIKKFSPKYNIRLTDGKAYPLIRVSVKSEYPAVVTARRPEDPNSVYFGPFPSSSTVRSVLRLLRRIFPYQSTLNHPKHTCLYYHLGLCPCLPAIARRKQAGLPAFANDEGVRAYKKTIYHIIDFLEGNTKKVVKDLERERDLLGKKEDFENAAKIQKQIQAIDFVTHPLHKPFEYVTNPNLKEDLRGKELLSLQKILADHGVSTSYFHRIECYDNSNIQGTNPTSSMVVMTDGVIDKSQYRKFKIKRVKGPNDFASMQEVLTRRFGHAEWSFPDLIIVDGGKGQISSAGEVLDNLKLDIPLVGLAKREETIITRDFQEIKLKHSEPALQLVMRIRDEAHRFAITFHRKIRSRSMLGNKFIT